MSLMNTNNSLAAPIIAAGLSVSDVERLAKAGVVINFKDITHVMPDAQKEDVDFADPFAQALIGRMRINPVFSHRLMQSFDRPRLAGAQHLNTIYVFFAMRDQVPVLLEDDASLFPSDALMAKLHLLLRQP